MVFLLLDHEIKYEEQNIKYQINQQDYIIFFLIKFIFFINCLINILLNYSDGLYSIFIKFNQQINNHLDEDEINIFNIR
tara:strand:+ start:71 stop:307 length:237 start_codon:yes stop_codon:yes gene_type:complete